MSEGMFYFITKEITFEETVEKGAILEATVMELEKVSGNGNVYRIEEAKAIAKSLIGKDVYYGTDVFGKHDNPIAKKKVSKKTPVGIVQSAWVVLNKIKAKIRIVNIGMIEALRSGVKYLFSVGGNAVSETLKKIGDKVVHILHGVKCNHLQIVDKGTPIGFPSAKMEKLIEINETVMICEGGLCKVHNSPKRKKRVIEIIDVEETIEITGVNDFEIEE